MISSSLAGVGAPHPSATEAVYPDTPDLSNILIFE